MEHFKKVCRMASVMYLAGAVIKENIMFAVAAALYALAALVLEVTNWKK